MTKLHFTSERPKVQGYYALTYPGDNYPELYEFVDTANGLIEPRFGESPDMIDGGEGLWCGPLEIEVDL